MKVKHYGDEARLDYCPVCQKTKDNPCFSVNIKSGLYMCHATGESGHIDKFPEIKKELEIESTDSNYVKKEKVINDFSELIINSNPLNEKWYEYLKGRGIENRDNINKLVRLGKYESMMIPVTDDQKVVGVKYRSLDKKLWSEKGSCLDYLLNWQNITDFEYLVIVEGEIDLLTALEVGFDNCVSLPSGAQNINAIKNQKHWLSKFESIIIATDNDDPGQECLNKIVYELRDLLVPLEKISYGKCKDLNEILTIKGKEKLRSILGKTTKIKTGYKNFKIENGSYIYFSDKGAVKVTDFIVKVEAYSDNYLIGKSITDGREREFKAKIADLLTLKGMAENIGLYIGSSSSLPLFINYLKEENKEKFIEEIDYYGIRDGKYYDQDSEVVCDKRDLKITKLSEIGPLTQEDREWLEENLIYMRADVNQSLLGICWALGRFHTQGTYPILEVSGTTSIGKTEYVEFISRLMFGGRENIKSLSTLSNHQIRAFSSCSNLTPWAIDEVKITGKFQLEKMTELYSTIRSVYDNKIVNQGNTTNKLTEFHLCSPLIISGETKLSDVSIQNRMISTHLTKNNKGSFEIYKKLKNTDILEKLGKAVLMDRLENGVITVNNAVLNEVKDERQLYNLTCLLKGLKALNRVLKIKESIVSGFIRFLNTVFSKEYTATENFIELLKLVEDAGIEDLESFYVSTPYEHWARFQLLYTAIAEQKIKTHSTLELLDMNTLKKQLIEEEFIVSANEQKRIRVDNFTQETKNCKIVRFKVIK
ncbi:toprim domain-containing protein [Fusobacterium gastrosuis]|uniref:toprim domain-containing protein n=1 Tax=Fusobacterium gastrosuis TaxID=1755100 RepID=UPI0029733AAD|nr:toprim domain-containing protein [Fusobacteriaceae bacterium]MDY5713851.1 toprim domain-containing protein [Fusobacterium gastrosuis]